MFRVDIQFVHISIKITSKKMLLELLDSIEEPVDSNRFRKRFKLYLDWLWGWARKLAVHSCHEDLSFRDGGMRGIKLIPGYLYQREPGPLGSEENQPGHTSCTTSS
jgi:hypothetical protein